jgi:hypothetical protein
VPAIIFALQFTIRIKKDLLHCLYLTHHNDINDCQAIHPANEQGSVVLLKPSNDKLQDFAIKTAVAC